MSVKCSFTPSCLHTVVTILFDTHILPIQLQCLSYFLSSLPRPECTQSSISSLLCVRDCALSPVCAVAVHIKAHLKVSARTVTRLSQAPFLEKGRKQKAGPEVKVIVTALASVRPSVLDGCRPDVDGRMCREWAKDRGMEKKERFCEPTAAGWNF